MGGCGSKPSSKIVRVEPNDELDLLDDVPIKSTRASTRQIMNVETVRASQYGSLERWLSENDLNSAMSSSRKSRRQSVFPLGTCEGCGKDILEKVFFG
jgi:hypothetical protein